MIFYIVDNNNTIILGSGIIKRTREIVEDFKHYRKIVLAQTKLPESWGD